MNDNHVIHFHSLDWEIVSVLHRHDGTFYFIRRTDGDTTTVCEVEEAQLMKNEQIGNAVCPKVAEALVGGMW